MHTIICEILTGLIYRAFSHGLIGRNFDAHLSTFQMSELSDDSCVQYWDECGLLELLVSCMYVFSWRNSGLHNCTNEPSSSTMQSSRYWACMGEIPRPLVILVGVISHSLLVTYQLLYLPRGVALMATL
jgi:hypothetical protein